MLHSRFDFEGVDPASHRLIVDDSELRKIQRYARNLEANVISSENFADSLTAECLSIRGSKFHQDELRRILKLFRTLKYLSVPAELIDILGNDLADTLRTIQITGTNNTRLPLDVIYHFKTSHELSNQNQPLICSV